MEQLYTATTIILVLQILYYDYFYKCWKRSENETRQLEVQIKHSQAD